MRSTDTRQHIVDAALALVADRGYSATSVDDVLPGVGAPHARSLSDVSGAGQMVSAGCRRDRVHVRMRPARHDVTASDPTSTVTR